VLVLDLVYAWVDPRVRFSTEGVSVAKPARKFKFRPFAARKSSRKRTDLVEREQKPHKPFSLEETKSNLSYFAQMVKSGMHSLYGVFRELIRYPSASVSLVIIFILFIGSIYALVALPYSEIGSRWYTDSLQGNTYVPRFARPEWLNLFRKGNLLSTEIQNSQDGTANKTVESGTNGIGRVNIPFSFNYDFEEIPEEVFVNFKTEYEEKRPFVVMTWVTPDQREIELKALSIDADKRVDIVDYLPNKFSQTKYFDVGGSADEKTDKISGLAFLFTDPESDSLTPIQGTYQLRVDGRLFEANSDLDAELVLLGQVYGGAGTDYMRRDLLVPLLWGMPFALIIGLLGATLTTLVSMVVAATGVWYGGWVDGLVQRITEVTMIFPVLAIGVLFYALFNVSLWTIIAIIIILNIFGSPTKAFRSAFLQIKEAPYMEAAQAYGASNDSAIDYADSSICVPRGNPGYV
jgi:peptide/nickel transport system permease protein